MAAHDNDPLTPFTPEPSAALEPPSAEAEGLSYRVPELFLIGAAFELMQAGYYGSLTDRSGYRKTGVIA
jgi:hypothetical protein